MIIVKALGILDIIIGIMFWIFGLFGIIPSSWIMFFGIVLCAKGIIFISGLSAASILDVVVGMILMVGTSVDLPKVIVIFVSLFLLQKGIFSLVT